MITSGLVRYHDDLTPMLVPTDDIHPHPDNPNNGDVEAVADSILTNGMYRPLYAHRPTGNILAGHATYHACLALGADVVPVLWLDVDDTVATKILLADNKIAALAVTDPALELALLAMLTDDLTGTGYTDSDLALLQRLTDTPLDHETLGTGWPTICVTVHPDEHARYIDLTAAATSERGRFQILLQSTEDHLRNTMGP